MKLKLKRIITVQLECVWLEKLKKTKNFLKIRFNLLQLENLHGNGCKVLLLSAFFMLTFFVFLPGQQLRQMSLQASSYLFYLLAIWAWQMAKVSNHEWAQLMMKAKFFFCGCFLSPQRLPAWPFFPAVVMIGQMDLLPDGLLQSLTQPLGSQEHTQPFY